MKNLIAILLAEVRKDVSGQFQIAMLLGDVEERVKLLRQCNQSKIEGNLGDDRFSYLNRILGICNGRNTRSG